MAISYKFSPEKLNDWFGLGLTLAQMAELNDFGISCKANAKGTKLEFGNASHGIVKDMPIKAGVLTMAKEGILPIGAKDSVAKKINAALSIALKQLEKMPLKKTSSAVWKDLDQLAAEGAKDDIEAEEQMEGSHFGKPFTEHMASALLDDPETQEAEGFMKEKLDPIKTHFTQEKETLVFPEKDEAVHGAKVSEVFPTDKDLALKMPKVKLSQATTMYQPVKATSDSSTYHCIGIAGKLKFGARWISNSNLSIRVEGPVGKFKAPLVAAGFNEDYIQKGYTSVHFNGIEELVAKRALGAVLMGTGLEFQTPIPDLGVINGEGA